MRTGIKSWYYVPHKKGQSHSGGSMRICTCVFLITVASLQAGCAIDPPAPYVPPDYGTAIDQADAESKAKDFLGSNLKDPYTAQISYETVRSTCFKDGLIMGGRTHCGYLLVANVNAKNSFGGYTGAIPYGFFFQSGQLRLVAQNAGRVGEMVLWRNL